MNIYKPNCDTMEDFLSGRPAAAEECGAKQTCSACRKEEPHGDHAALKCGTPQSTTIPDTAAVGDTFYAASLNVDTAKYHAPCVRFEFAGNIVTAPGTVALNFQLTKQCKYQGAAIPVGPAWSFSRTGLTAAESDMFAFSVCDCGLCDDECCSYSVVVTVEALTVDGNVAINNASLTALVVEQSHC